MRFVFAFFILCLLSGCAAVPEKEKKLVLKPVSFSDLPGWNRENFTDFLTAYQRSCARILKRSPDETFGPDGRWGTYRDWQPACLKITDLKSENASSDEIRQILTDSFIPYRVMADRDGEGLFTGYYEASLNGSRKRHGPYQYPLRARPDDLVMVQLGDFREELKGQRIAGRVVGGNLKPYETHAEIVGGELPDHLDMPLVWVDDPVNAFFVQIQGSGVVSLDDGSVMRIGYAGQNGHPYYAIGRELVKRDELEKEDVSMQSIRAWLSANPDQAQEIMLTNKSYVFFRELENQEGPVGGEGLPLTPERSLAVDRSIIPYGMPVWLNAHSPEEGRSRLQKLMVTQDTGGAIRGPVRGDFFWGYGRRAEDLAGKMKSKGSYWFFLPKGADVSG